MIAEYKTGVLTKQDMNLAVVYLWSQGINPLVMRQFFLHENPDGSYTVALPKDMKTWLEQTGSNPFNHRSLMRNFNTNIVPSSSKPILKSSMKTGTSTTPKRVRFAFTENQSLSI